MIVPLIGLVEFSSDRDSAPASVIGPRTDSDDREGRKASRLRTRKFCFSDRHRILKLTRSTLIETALTLGSSECRMHPLLTFTSAVCGLLWP